MSEVQSLCEQVRACPRAAGAGEIKLPGDPERQERARRRAAGISLDEETWKQHIAAAKSLGVSVPI